MKNFTGAQGAVIVRLLIESYRAKAHRILEAGFTGQKKDKLGHTRYYANGRQVKNPNAKEKSAIHAAAGTPLPAGQSPSHNDAATRVDALDTDTPPEHVAALANDLMKMSVEDLTKMAKAPAEEEPKQKRANAGGEVGPNGEHYKGGAFIATTEMPKSMKDKIKRAAGDGMETVRDLEGNVTREKPPHPGMMSISGTMMGTLIGRKGEVNEQYLDYLQASPEKRKQVADLAEKYRAGENWAPINDYPNVALGKHIYQLAAAGLPIAGSLLGRLKGNADFQKYYKKQTEKAAATAPTPAPEPEAPAATAPAAPTAGMSADANALDALRLKSNKKTHNPAHINPEALSSLKAQGFIDDKNKLTPAGRTHLYAEKLKGAPAPTGTAAASPAAPKPKWKRAARNKDSLISIVKRKGGINSDSVKAGYDYQADIVEGGLLHAIRKQGMGLDEMAQSLQVEGHIIVPEGMDPGEHLLNEMKARHHSALRNTDKEIESEAEAFYKAQHEAKQGGHDERSIEGSRASGISAGESAGQKEGATELDEWDNSGTGETGSGEDPEAADRNYTGPVDTSFDFGANADEPKTDEPTPAPTAPPELARTKPSKAVVFNQPITGPSGAKLGAYQWQHKVIDDEDKNDGEKAKRVSDWEKAISSVDTNKDIVHHFTVTMPDGTAKTVSLESAVKLLGYEPNSEGAEQVKGMANTAKSLAKAQMQLSLAQHAESANEKIKSEVAEMSPPPIKIEKGSFLGKPNPKHDSYRMGDSRIALPAGDNTPPETIATELAHTWRRDQVTEKGGDNYDTHKTMAKDLQGKISKLEKSLSAKEPPTPNEAPATPAPAAAPPPDDAVARHMQRQAFTGVDSEGRTWQNGELVAAKDDEPAKAGKAEPEKKSTKFESPGDVITPSSQSRIGENPLEVVGIKDGWAIVGYANHPDKQRVRMPSESLDLFRQDQQGRVDLPDHTGSEAIDKISNGKGKLLGSGDDGLAYDAGDKVVKVSTTAHFHAFGHEHRSPAEAVHRLKGQAEINNDMIKAGVPGLLPQTFEEHGNRGFITMEKLDTTTKLTPEQVNEVARNLEAMHKLGYVLGDQIQVGIDFAGHPKIFDTGKAVKAGSGGYSKDDHFDYDNSNLERFFKDNGLTYEDPEQKKLTKLRDSTRAQIEKIKAAPKDIDQGKAQFLLHSFSLHLNLLAHQTGGVLYAYAMADDPDVKKLELIARHTIDTDSFHDKTVKKLKPMDAPAAEPAAAAPDQPGFTGVDAQGREWQNGELVAAKDEPAKAPAANADLFGNPSKAAPKGPETMPGLFGDAVPIAPDTPSTTAGEPLPGSDNPLDRAGAGRGRQDATQDMFGLFGPATKNKIDQVNNDPDPVTEPSTPAAAAAEPQPNDTPRTVAARVTAAMAGDFENARASAVPNMGADIKGSARHKAMAWSGLKDAEANGTAEAIVKRDELLKHDPSNLSSILKPSNFLGVLTSHLTMQAFPKEVHNYGQYTRDTAEHVSTPAKLREQYYEAFTEVKQLTEKLASTELDPRKINSEVNNKLQELIGKYRGKGLGTVKPLKTALGRELRADLDRFNPVANSLVNMQQRVLGRGANSILGKVNDFGKRLNSASELNADDKDKITGYVADILEGKSFNQAFDTVEKKEKGFDYGSAYGEEIIRTGGKKINMNEQSTDRPGSKVFMDDMKVRGVQFGNSLPDRERVYHAEKSAEALSDLTDILGLPDEAAGLGGKLGLAIGARGRQGAKAHFEPWQADDSANPSAGGPVINLTRASGAGSLAHEWGHGLDHYAANNKPGAQRQRFLTEADNDNVAPLTSKAMRNVQEAMQSSGFNERLKDASNAEGISHKEYIYWSSSKEKFARTFERHVQNKLHEAGRENTYLTGLHKQGHPLWPTNDEMAHMAPHMDALIAAIAAEKFPGHTMPASAPAAPRAAAPAPAPPPPPHKFIRRRDWKDADQVPPDDLVKKHGWSWTGTDDKGNQWKNGRFIGEEGTYKESVMPTDPHADKIKLVQAIIARRGLKPPQPKAQAKKIPEASEDADPRVKRIRELMDAYC